VKNNIPVPRLTRGTKIPAHNSLKVFLNGLALLLFLSRAQGIPPENFQVFSESIDRMIYNQKYFFLTDYFRANADIFINQNGLLSLGIRVYSALPHKKLKNDILEYLEKIYEDRESRSRIILEKGKLCFFYDSHEQALEYFKSSAHPEAQYYRALIYFRASDLQSAHDALTGYLLSGDKSFIPQEAYFLLSQIYLAGKNYSQALQNLLLSRVKGVRRNILLYNILKNNRETGKAQEVFGLIKKNYSSDPEGKLFISRFPDTGVPAAVAVCTLQVAYSPSLSGIKALEKKVRELGFDTKIVAGKKKNNYRLLLTGITDLNKAENLLNKNKIQYIIVSP